LIDENCEIPLVTSGPNLLGFLANFKSSTIIDEEMNERTILLAYFTQLSGSWFKAMVCFQPYFYVATQKEYISEMQFYLFKKFEKKLTSVDIVEKVNLQLINHLSGKKDTYLKLSFHTISDLMHVRLPLLKAFEKNKLR